MRAALRQVVAAAVLPAADAPLFEAGLVATARAVGLAPLLGARLAQGTLATRGPDQGDSAAALLAAHRRCLARELAREAALAPVLAALDAAGVPPLLLKGSALLGSVYGPGARPMSDVDLLVPARHFSVALEVLRHLGGRAQRSVGRRLTDALFHEVHVHLGGLALDLHRGLSPWPLFAVDHDGVLARAQRSPTGRLRPAAADLLLHLAVHAAGDGFALSLRELVDGLLIVSQLRPAPEEVIARAVAWRARKATATLLDVLASAGLSDPAWRAAARSLHQGGARTALARRALADELPPGHHTSWRRRRRMLRAADAPLRALGLVVLRGALRADAVLPR